MASEIMSRKGGRRLEADRRSKFITPYSGPERRSDNERRGGIDRRVCVDSTIPGDRRFDTNRRLFSYTKYIPERRITGERRSGIDRRKASRQ